MTTPKTTPASTGTGSVNTAATPASTETSGTLSPQPAAVAAAPGTLSRNDATRVMVAIDELRKRTVREVRTLNASLKRGADTIKQIEVGQKARYLDDLADLHKVVGEAYDLGGY